MKLFHRHILLASLPLLLTSLPVGAAQAQSNSVQNSQDLQNALRRIARNSNDSSALADAGLAALAIGDTRAAIGFLARADQIYPRSGRVKAGLGKALLEERNPFGALRYFDQAIENGTPVRDIAADRGLAYDLIGRNIDAQKDYELALQYGSNDELLNRYAISLGISGNIEGSDAKLNPLLQKSDRGAWRNRAFILAMNGKAKDANAIARQTMQKRMARAIKPFFERMPKLTAAQKAAAIHFGHFPASENIGVDVASVQYAANSAVRGGDGADAGLIPLGEPLGAVARKPRVLAMPDTSPRRRPGSKRISSKRQSGKKPFEIVVKETGRSSASNARQPLSRSNRGNETTREVAVNSREGRRLLKRAARDGSAEAQALLDRQSGSQEATKEIAIASPAPIVPKPKLVESKTAVPKPSLTQSAVPKKSAASGPVSPGFKTPVARPEVIKTEPVKLARAETKVPELVSASVERKVAIGDVTPQKTETIAPQKTTATAVQKPVFTAPKKTVAVTPKPVPTPVKSEPIKEPIQMVSFDLARSVPAPSPATRSPVKTAQAQPVRKPLSDIINSISIPDAEKKTDIVPVDLESITPASSKPKEAPKEIAKKEEAKKTEPNKDEHPKRYWVQIATGSNLSALKYDFRQMKKKHSGLFGDMDGWTSPWGNTRRMAIGPFEDLSAAKKFDSEFRKKGGDSFAWVSSKGTEVNKLTK